MAYDPCYAYELSVIVLDGIRKMYYEDQDVFYYITLMNENYEMPILPLGSTEGICKGIYRLSERTLGPEDSPHVQLFGSGAILRETLRAQDLLEQKFGVASNVYSVTSYKNLYYDGRDCDRWNRLHPGETPRRPYVEQVLERRGRVRSWRLPITSRPCRWRSAPGSVPTTRCWAPTASAAARPAQDLRRFFEVDAENIALTALAQLARKGKYPKAKLCEAIKVLGLDPNKPNQVGM